jgi:C-terminal processing protease CtpA/Prc
LRATGSFSTTGEFLSTLHFHHRATFVGEETAAGYYGNTSGMSAQLVLPNSKLRLELPLVTYYLAVSGKPHADHGILPDVSVRYSIEDLLAGRDKVLDVALKLARKP